METVNTSNCDDQFKYDIAAHTGAENIRQCYSCGTCTAACPIFRIEEGYNPRKIIHQILLGMRKQVLSSPTIWLCARCYACTAHCPQNVSFADIMAVLRDMAVTEGYAAPDLLEKVQAVSNAAHEFRRDCINNLTDNDKSDLQENLKQLKETIEKI